MRTHRTAIRAVSKEANLQQSRLWPASALPLSFVFPTVVSASALIIDVSPCIRQTMMDWPWEVCRAAGWGTKQPPTHCVGPNLLRKATVEQRGAMKQSTEKVSKGKSPCVFWPYMGADSNAQCFFYPYSSVVINV